MPLPSKNTWCFKRTPNANGKNATDLDRTHQNSTLASLKAERSAAKIGKPNRHPYNCESLRAPEAPSSPILNGPPPAVPPKTSCDPVCTSFVAQTPRLNASSTSAVHEHDITKLQRVRSCQVESEDIIQPSDSAFSFLSETVTESLTQLPSLSAVGARPQTTQPGSDPKGSSAQLPSSHPRLTSSDPTASEILIARDPALSSIESRKLGHSSELASSVETRPAGGRMVLSSESGSTASEKSTVQATSNAKLPPTAIPVQTGDTIPLSSELVINTPTPLSMSRPCSLMEPLHGDEDLRSSLATTPFAPSEAPSSSQNNVPPDRSLPNPRTRQLKPSSTLTSRRAGRSVSRSMEAYSVANSCSSEDSGTCMTDAATVVRRLFNNPLYSDLALSVDETTFRVHRGILAEHCAYFRKLFDNARSRNPTTEIKLVDCSFKPVAVKRARAVTIVRATKADHEEKAEDTSASQRREDNGGSGSTGDDSGEKHRRDTAVSSSGKPPSLEKASAKADPNSCQVNMKEPGSAGPDSSRFDSTEESRSRVLPPENFKQSVPLGPLSAEETFTAMFVSDERSMGYTSHHFALFLQQLYGILAPTELELVDLLPVLRIAYLYGVPGLITVLADLIFDSLRLSVETWPAAIRFTERYQLQDIRRRALEHASGDKSLWKLAVEMLNLDDFKVFLRGVGRAGAGRGQKAEDVRGVKDELLMMFLLVHYQEVITASPSSSRSSSSSTSSQAPVCYSSDDPSLARRDFGDSEGPEPRRRRSRDGYQSNSTRIRQQLLLQWRALTSTVSQAETPSLRTRFSSKLLRLTDQVGSRTLDLNMASMVAGRPEQGLWASVADTTLTEKADSATAWMIGLKRECGWDGRLSYLD
ncbi:unnamed protein product [Mortierella alpina]